MRKVLVVVALAGCAVIDSKPGDGEGSGSGSGPGSDPGDENLTAAERAWIHQALPVLTQQCGVCHGGRDPSIGFLAGDTAWEQRANILASGVVNLEYPGASRLLTKGGHSGPGMTANAASAILTWIQAEHDALQ